MRGRRSGRLIEESGICHIYVARLSSLRTDHPAFLDALEANRRARYRFRADRDRFTLGAVLLRAVVAAYTGVDPSSVAVDRTCQHCGASHGRPRLASGQAELSVSHSGDVVVVALSTAGPVGVDVEFQAPIEYEELLASVCTPAEEGFVVGASDFYTYWTRKEAVLKAMGEGLRRPMTDLTVAPPLANPALLAVAAAPPPPYRLEDISVGEGYVAAAAVLAAKQVQFTVHDAASVLAGL